MTTLQELETAIKQLPEGEIRQLVDRLQDYLEEKWDRQIESDLRTGKLDRLLSRAQADITANRVKAIEEIPRLNLTELWQKIASKEIRLIEAEELEDLLDTISGLEGLLSAKEEGTIPWEQVKEV